MASGTPRLKVKNLPSIDPAVYSALPANELVVFAVRYLQERGIPATVEEMVSVCFRLFPHSFALKNYPRWPDSALVIRRLNDCRDKGFLRGNSMEGFELKFKGEKLAERMAKSLGLVKAAPAKRKVASSKPKIKKAQPAPRTKKIAKPLASKKKKSVPVKKTAPKSSTKTAAPKPTVRKVPVKAPPQVKNIRPKSKPVVQKQQPVTSSLKGKKAPPKNQKIRTRPAQPVQMKMLLPTKEVPPAAPVTKPSVIKKRKPAPAPQLTKLQAIQPEIVVPAKPAAPMLVVSKEEKVKAEKIVRSIERSDAYRTYSRNGHGSKLSEFDFRNMLLATMESTPETLARNVQLFKSSAAIHNRQDLIKFLDACESMFASLLKPSEKKTAKRK